MERSECWSSEHDRVNVSLDNYWHCNGEYIVFKCELSMLNLLEASCVS